MTLNEYLQREGKTLDSIKKGKTLTQYIQEEKIKPYYETIDLTNSLVTDWNNRTTADYTKYGDYSSHTAQYDDFSSRSRQILSNLEKNNKLFTEEQYSEIRKLAEDIGNNSVTAKEAVQSIVDQYSAYTPAQKKYDYYTNYDIAAAEKELEEYGGGAHKPGDPFGKTRSQLQQEIFTAKYYKSKQRKYEREAEFKENFGDMTPEEVDKYEKVFTDRINEGKGNKLDEYALEWLQNYDVTYGVQSEEYYNQRLELLNKKLAEEDAKTETVTVYDDNDMKERTYTIHTEEYEKIKSEIEIITAARTNAIREQEVNALVDDAMSAENFEEISTFVSKVKPVWERNEAADVGEEDMLIEYINGDTTLQSKITMNRRGEKDAEVESYGPLGGLFARDVYDWAEYGYDQFEPEEKKIATYWYYTDREKFYRYLEIMEPELKKRGGIEDAEKLENVFGGKTYVAIKDTAEKFLKYDIPSTLNYITGNNDTVEPVMSNYRLDAMRSNLEGFDAFWFDAVSAGTHMVPSILANIIVPGSGFVVTGLTAASSAYNDGLSSGMTESQARNYATLVGASEAALSSVIGGIGGLGGKLTGITAEKIAAGISKGLARFAVDVTINAGSEFIEEGLQVVLEPLFKNLAMGEAVNSWSDIDWGEAVYSGLVGAFMGGTSNIVPAIGRSSAIGNEIKIGTAIIDGGNIDTVLMAAKSMGELDAEIAGQVQALENNKKTTNKKGEYNAAYKRMLGKVAVSTAQSVTEVKQNVTKKAVSNELHRRGVDKKTADKVTDIVSKYVSGQNLSSAEQGYLKNNSVASNLVHEISLAQEQVKATQAGVTGSKVANTGITPSEEGYTSSAVDTAPSPQGEGLTAPEWAVSLVNQLNTIDSAAQVVNMAVTGKSVEDEKNAETNRMIKLLSIASGKTTAQQEAEAGDIPYSQYIKEKEAAAKKENTAESGEVEVSENGKNNTDVTPSEESYTSSTVDTAPSPQGEGIERKAERKQKAETLAKGLGLSLEWSEEVSSGKYNPKTRTITLNPNLTTTGMYIEILKHEFTHDLENRKLYKNFKNYLFNNSEHFIKFCEEQVKKLKDKGIIDETATGRDAVYILRGYTYLVYKDSKELTAEEKAAFDRESAEREMICDFVAKKLLDKGNEAECIEALKELAENQRSAIDRFVDLIRNTIYHIKDAFGKTTLTDELEYLERRLKQVYESNVDKKKTAQGGEKLSIEYVSAKENEEIKELLNRVKEGSFKANELVYFEDVSDDIAEKIYRETKIDVKGFKIAIEARQLEHILKDHGHQGEADHSMSNDSDIAKLEYVLKNPTDITYSGKTQAYSSFINGYNRTADTVLYEKEIGDKSYYVVQAVPVTKKKTLFIVSAFIGEKGYKKETSRLTNAKSPVATSKNDFVEVSNNRVPQNDTTVNSNSMQENEKHSLDLEENISERENELVPEVTNKTKTKAKKENINIPAEATELTNKYFRGELTQEEYQTKIDDLRAKAVGKYGAFKTGELAEDQTQIPKKVSDDGKVRQHVRTQLESGIMSDEIRTDVTARMLQGALSYKVISNKKAQAHANWAVQNGTAVKEWEAAVNGDGKVGKEQIAVGETLLKLAAERNDAYGVMKLVAEISEMATRAGQMVQAFSMLKRMDGIGKLYYLQKCVDTINKDLEKRFGQKYADGKIKEIPQVKINETLATQLAESKTQKDFDVTYEALLQSIAEQVPVTFSDKWNAWRYLAMLCNPRTHIRNFVGNGIFLPTVRLKDVCATIIERMTLDEQKRTKSAIVKKEYRNFAQADYVNVEDIITGNGKMNPSNAIKDRQTVFDAKWLETLRKWNFDLLDKEDKIFLKKHYAHALGGFLQARNIDITKDVPMEVMEEARIYAMKEAWKATYRDASAVTDILNRISKTKVGAWNVFVEGVLPFKKTPVNIIRRGIEYSPIGLIKTLTKGTVDLKKGNISASEYIDGIAGGLTGTGILFMGMLLSSLGFIKLTGSFGDDEEDKFDKLTGKQEYAVEIGGISYTLDWAAPVCIPFFMGVELQKALEEEGNGNLWQSIKNVGENALEPIINLSMLSGMQDVISSSNNASPGEQVGSVIWETALSYGSQLLPTIGGSVARTIDGTRRTTYIDKTSWLSDMGQMALNQIEAKIPFVSTLRSEYVDEFGRTQDNGNFFTRAIQNFVSPGYISEIENDSVIKELKELYEDTGEDTLPDKPQKYIKIGSEKVHLTAEKYEEYAKEVGQARYEYAEEFIDSRGYSDLNKSERVEVLKDLYSYALAKGKKNASKYKLPNTYKKVYEAEKNGISPVDYYMSKIATNEDNADTDKSGGVSKKEKIAAIKKMDVSNDIKAALIALYS